MQTHGGTRGLLSWSPRHLSPGELAGAGGGRAVVRRHLQRALCSSPFIALIGNLCCASSSPPLVCPRLFNFHSLLKAGCQVPLPARLPACPGGSGLPPRPSLQVRTAAGLCPSKRRPWRADPSVWDQQPTALAAAAAVGACWGGGLKDKGGPSLGRQGGCRGRWVSCLPAGRWLGCVEMAAFDLGLLHAAVERVTGWGWVYCLE